MGPIRFNWTFSRVESHFHTILFSSFHPGKNQFHIFCPFFFWISIFVFFFFPPRFLFRVNITLKAKMKSSIFHLMVSCREWPFFFHFENGRPTNSFTALKETGPLKTTSLAVSARSHCWSNNKFGCKGTGE